MVQEIHNKYLDQILAARKNLGRGLTSAKLARKLSAASLQSSSQVHSLEGFAKLETETLKSNRYTKKALKGGVPVGPKRQLVIVNELWTKAKARYNAARAELDAAAANPKIKISAQRMKELHAIIKNAPTKFKKEVLKKEFDVLVGKVEEDKKLSKEAILARRRAADTEDMGLHQAATSAADLARWRTQEMDKTRGGQLPRAKVVGSIGDLSTKPKPPAPVSEPVIPMATPDM